MSFLIDFGLFALWVFAFVIFKQTFKKWAMKNISFRTFQYVCLILEGLSTIVASSFGRTYLSLFLLAKLVEDILWPMIERYRISKDPKVRKLTNQIVEIAKSRQRPQ